MTSITMNIAYLRIENKAHRIHDGKSVPVSNISGLIRVNMLYLFRDKFAYNLKRD